MSMQQKLKSLIPQRHKNAIRSGIAFGRRLLVQPRMMPAFTIIGAQKSGTSSLFDYLIRHGSYLRPLLKDVYFFDRDYRKGLDWYLSFFPTVATMVAREAETGGRIVTGESATHYLLHPWSPARMRETFPKMKLVVLLRDPVQRAISHYYHNVRTGIETAPSALVAFQLEEERIGADTRRMIADPSFYSRDFAAYSCIARGRYAEQLQRWFAAFLREQMLVICSERFFTETDANVRLVCRFIGIPEKSLSDYPPVGQDRNRKEDEKAAAFAADYFRPHNAALYRLLRDNYGWPA